MIAMRFLSKRVLRKSISQYFKHFFINLPTAKDCELFKRKWTEEEIDLLKKGLNPPDRSLNSIRIMKIRLGLCKFKKNPWSPEDKSKLRDLLKEGKTTKEISYLIPHTQRSIQKEIVRQKIPHKTLVRFTNLEKLIFLKFLKENWEGKTTKEIVELWNNKNKRKINEKKVYLYLKALNLKITKSEAIKIAWLKKREKDWLKEKDIESIKQRRIKIMSERYSKKLDIWSGLNSTEDYESDLA